MPLVSLSVSSLFFFFNDTATTEIYTLSLHDALPISDLARRADRRGRRPPGDLAQDRSEEHTSEIQSLAYLVCRLLLEKKNIHKQTTARAETGERGVTGLVQRLSG